MHVVVMQNGVDVKLQLYKIRQSGGQTEYMPAWDAIDSPNEFKGEELVSEIADEAGDYLLTVEQSPGAASPGEDYAITFDSLHQATEEDVRYLRAERNYLKGWSRYDKAGSMKGPELNEAVRQALSLLEDALRDLSGTGQFTLRLKVDVLLQITKAHLTLSRREDALKDTNQAYETAQSMADPNERSIALFKVAASYNMMNRVEEMRKAVEGAVASADGLPPEDRVSRLMTLGEIYMHEGENQKAAESYEAARPLIPEIADPGTRSYYLTAAGMYYFNVGQLLRALDLYTQALKLQGDKVPLERAYTLHQLGVVYGNLGRLQESLDALLELRDYRRSDVYRRALPQTPSAQEEEERAVVHLLNNIGATYAALNQEQLALDYYQQALDLNKGKFGDAEAYTRFYRGNAYAAVNQEQDAKSEYDMAAKLWKEDKRGRAMVLVNEGRLFFKRGEKKKALEEYLKPAGELQAASGDRYGLAYTLTNMGTTYLDLGDLENSSKYLNDALKLRVDVGDLVGQIITRYQLARLERARGKYEEGLAQLHLSEKLIEDMRGSILESGLRASYFSSFHDAYALMVGLYLDMYRKSGDHGYLGLALETAEKARARSLLDTLTTAKADIRSGVNPALRERERRAEDRVAEAMALAAHYGSEQQQGDKSARRKAVDEQLNRALEELRLARADIVKDTQRSRPYAQLIRTEPLGSGKIQALLDDNTLLLEYVLGEGESYLLIVSNKEIKSVLLPGRQQIDELAKDAYKQLEARGNLPESMSYDERLKAEKELDEAFAKRALPLSLMLLGQVADSLGGKRLLLVKDGALQYIPFGALPEPLPGGRDVGTSPLLLNHEIVVLPSATAVSALREQARPPRPGQKTLLMLGDPVYNLSDKRAQNSFGGVAAVRGGEAPVQYRRLAFSPLEIQGVTDPRLIPPASVKVWRGFEVNRRNVTGGALGRYRLVHFSTHGFFDFDHPNGSGLVLSVFGPRGEVEKRPILGLNDIYNLDLAADMVVLSACQTALGEEVRGEGLVGITRGFMYAGAPRVVSSLWKVDDPETAKLMSSFYWKLLREDLPAATALWEAQKEVWNEHKQSPYYWAAFELQGEWQGGVTPAPRISPARSGHRRARR